jgi:GT2 family glycosyltransferase
MPRFSIILVHYQKGTPHRELLRGVNSLMNQTYQDFEILAYHDGPFTDTSVTMPIPFVCMEKNYADWGHTLRDRGIHEAKGDYIIHFNSDNILYPNALEEISKAIDRPPRLLHGPQKQVLDNNNIIVFSIWAHGLQRFGDYLQRFLSNPEYRLLLTGNPPRALYIDAMQLVMRRDLWLAEGGWYDKSNCGDGIMYQKFAAKYGYRSVETILGEHF